MKFQKEKLLHLKSHTNPNVVMVCDFKTLLLPINMTFRQKHNRETLFWIKYMIVWGRENYDQNIFQENF